MTVLASLAYQDSTLVLEEMGSGPDDESLDQAVQRLADYTGDDLYRIRNTALLRLADYVANNFIDARVATRWLAGLDKNLGVWIACQAARTVLQLVKLKRLGLNLPRIAIETTEAWVRGDASIEEVNIARDDAYVFASDLPESDNYWAARSAFQAASVPDLTYSYPFTAADAVGDAIVALSFRGYSPPYSVLDQADYTDYRDLSVVTGAIMNFPVTV